MPRFDRRLWGIDHQFGLFIAIAPMASLVVFAVLMASETVIRLDFSQGLAVLLVILSAGSIAMAFHYIVAILPSVVVWAVVMAITREAEIGRANGMRLAAVLTGGVASSLILIWLRDPDYLAMLPRLTAVAVISSYLTVEVLLFAENVARNR